MDTVKPREATKDAPIGGQAVLEGVMMRGISTWAVAVRKPSAAQLLAGGPDSKEGAKGEIDVVSEPLVSSRLAETVAREAGVSTAVLDPLEGLTPEQEEGGGDYFSVMRQNLAALRAALGCT